MASADGAGRGLGIALEIENLLKKERVLLSAPTMDFKAMQNNLIRLDELFKELPLELDGLPKIPGAADPPEGDLAACLRRIMFLRIDNLEFLGAKKEILGRQIISLGRGKRALLAYMDSKDSR